MARAPEVSLSTTLLSPKGTQDEAPGSGGPFQDRIPVAPGFPAAILEDFPPFPPLQGLTETGKGNKVWDGIRVEEPGVTPGSGTAGSGTGTAAGPGMVTPQLGVIPQTQRDPTNSG